MHPDLQASLHEQFAEIFPPRDEPLPINVWGFDFGDGWYPIVECVLAIAQVQYRKNGQQTTLTECKQKAGTLRIRFRGPVDDRLREAVDAAEELSARTCQWCGRTTLGSISSSGVDRGHDAQAGHGRCFACAHSKN